MTSRSSSSSCSITSDRHSCARALRVPRSSHSGLERSAFCIATRWRASTINRLILARRLYQVLRIIAKLACPRTACRLILLSSGPILVSDLPIVGKPHYFITWVDYLRGSRNYRIRDASHRNNHRPDQNFGNDGSNTVASGFLRKVLVPAGGFEIAVLLPRRPVN
jgi:hypothetical protein